MLKMFFQLLFLASFLGCSTAQSEKISILENKDGIRLLVDGRAFMINGMNWDYYPIGTNYTYSLWAQPEEKIKAALDSEMALLKNIGVNAIRVYTGIPKKWIQYIYEVHGIYTMLNHTFGRYGLTLEGQWVANTEYADPRVKKILIDEVSTLAKEYKNTPGLLLYLLGNENNYGLFWDGAETENIPVEDRKSTQRARAMYQLFNEAVLAMKAVDTSRPIAICNGDLQFLDIIKEECKDADIFGTNVYRGVSFDNLFERVKKEFGKPVLFTEFGADAFDALQNKEDQLAQAKYIKSNWKEVYENAAGLGKAGNSIGGFTFQFSDGWWKFGQTYNLKQHDTNASWGNGGYKEDFKKGQNNMNEEWFGVCAKGPTQPNGLYQSLPRAAYFVLEEIHQLNPYARGMSLEKMDTHFNKINIDAALQKAATKN